MPGQQLYIPYCNMHLAHDSFMGFYFVFSLWRMDSRSICIVNLRNWTVKFIKASMDITTIVYQISEVDLSNETKIPLCREPYHEGKWARNSGVSLIYLNYQEVNYVHEWFSCKILKWTLQRMLLWLLLMALWWITSTITLMEIQIVVSP